MAIHSQFRELLDGGATTSPQRGVVVGSAISVLLAGIAIAYGELTDTRAAARPFMILALVLSAWLGGRYGGAIATVVAATVFLAYSTNGDIGEDDAWFFVAFVCAAIAINLLAAERHKSERRLRETRDALADALETQQQLLDDARESSARYLMLADSMPQLVWTAGSDGIVNYYNARVAEYSGLARSGDDWTWQPMVHTDDMDRTMKAWAAAAASLSQYSMEHRLRMADGSYRWHVSRAVPVEQTDGSVLWYGTATDVEALHRALAAKDEFLALVSHDLRSPLTTILGYAGLLKRGILQKEEDQKVAFDDIEFKAKQLNDTIEELVELARVKDDSLFEPEPIPVEHLVRQVVDDVRENSICEVSVRANSANLVALGNDAYTRRIVRNLLTNAVKYGLDSLIEVDIISRDDVVEVQVADRGIGIDEANLDLLFNPFYRAQEATSVHSQGLGIGLTLCKRLADAQRGNIGAREREGGGSVFWFTLQRRMS